MRLQESLLHIAQPGTQDTAPSAAAEKQDRVGTSDKEGTKHPILMYLPNRIFDLLDIFRVRVRVGPGISIGVRATTPISAFVGFHSSVFAGLPGPRGNAEIPWPVGIENRGGVQASVVDLSSQETYYDPLEIGLEAHPLISGALISALAFLNCLILRLAFCLSTCREMIFNYNKKNILPDMLRLVRPVS